VVVLLTGEVGGGQNCRGKDNSGPLRNWPEKARLKGVSAGGNTSAGPQRESNSHFGGKKPKKKGKVSAPPTNIGRTTNGPRPKGGGEEKLGTRHNSGRRGQNTRIDSSPGRGRKHRTSPGGGPRSPGEEGWRQKLLSWDEMTQNMYGAVVEYMLGRGG